jgi:inner membrane protein involved in colicin E2 resistance
MDGMPAEVVNRRGLYDVTLYRVVHDRSLRQETIFECVLSIPATEYQIARRLIYYPGPVLFLFLFYLLFLLFNFLSIDIFWLVGRVECWRPIP